MRENQAIGEQAISAGIERDAWREEAAAASSRAAAAEAASRAADADSERLRKTYEVRGAISCVKAVCRYCRTFAKENEACYSPKCQRQSEHFVTAN